MKDNPYRRRVGVPNPRPTTHQWKEGDRVAYSKAWMVNSGIFTGDIPRARGTIVDFETIGGDLILAVIEWDSGDHPQKVNVLNLSLVTKDGVVQDRD